jgi:hypothetical protein
MSNNPQDDITIQLDPRKIPYAEFVNLLFVKPETVREKLAHAAVGMIGEAIELHYASSRENEIEELGDYEFYYQAFFNHAPATQGAVDSKKLIKPRHYREASEQLIYWSNEVLDLAKKGWIYERDLTTLPFLMPLFQCRTALEYYYLYRGITLATAESENREKLLKRYAGGKYSNEAAQARADKA